MTTPTGDPTWLRTADPTVYGGHVGKHDYEQQGVTNPLTDIAAAEFLRLTADLAAVSVTAPFAMLSVTCDDATPAAPTVNWIHAMHGTRATSYLGSAAPTGFPAAARNSDGNVTITWPASLTDYYGVAAAPHIVAARAMSSGHSTTVSVDSTLAITVAALDGATPTANATIVVWVY